LLVSHGVVYVSEGLWFLPWLHQPSKRFSCWQNTISMLL
jgi:hypothetical protein